MYVPAALVSTVLVAVIFADILPSKLSVAVAPASVYVAPWFIAVSYTHLTLPTNREV